MHEVKPNPSPSVQPLPTVPQRSPSSVVPHKIQNLFLSKTAKKEEEAQQILHPQDLAPSSITDSLNTGKLSKFVKYFKNGTF